jgi:hypothetical protein
MATESIPAPSAFRVGSAGHAYNEAAFRYFLNADRNRVQRSERSMILLLVSVRREPGRSTPLNDPIASALFAGLAASVREVDFVGWFRQGRVAGAVLPQAPRAPRELRDVVGTRILTSLRKFVPADAARHLHVRVVHLDAKEQQ